MDHIIKDERFSHIVKDPRFRRIPKKEKKVKIDQRFKGMFTEKQFKIKSTVDKRGRKVTESSNENLRRFYEVSDSEDSDDDESEEEESALKSEKRSKTTDQKQKQKNKIQCEKYESNVSKGRKQQENEGKSLKKHKNILKDVQQTDSKKINKVKTKMKITKESDDSGDDDEDDYVEEDSDESEQDNAPDLARGEGNVQSSSEEEEYSDEESGPSSSQIKDEFDHKWGELDKTVAEVDELSCRLALCNMEWDRIKSKDIFVLLNSFKPAGGYIRSVVIYPSEFGQQRMKEEQIKGPIELVESSKDDDLNNSDNQEEFDENPEGSRYHREKLRQYQLNRLRYYYAVVELDSVDTANHIYTECDGMEYESSATRMDLRFIPDGMTFDQEAKDACIEMPLAGTYKPSIFLSTALSQSKVNLTWDETDQERIRITMRPPSKKDEVTEEDFKAYLASSSENEDDPYGDIVGSHSDDESDGSVEDEEEEKQIEKYKRLMMSIKDTEEKKYDRGIEMEVTWEPGLKEVTEKFVKKKNESDNQTPWEQYLMKKKEKKNKKRDERMKMVVEMKTKDTSSKQVDLQDEDVEEMGSGYQAALSDDEVDINRSDPFFQQDLSSDEKRKHTTKGVANLKKKKKVETLTEEERQEKQRKEAELELLMLGEEDTHHFNLKDLINDNKVSKKKKKKQKKDSNNTVENDFQVDVEDDRFKAMYSSHLYNIDPSAPEYKKTKGMEALIDEKIKRMKEQTTGKGDNQISKKKKRKLQETVDSESIRSKLRKEEMTETEPDTSLSSLVKSVKVKTESFHAKSKIKKS